MLLHVELDGGLIATVGEAHSLKKSISNLQAISMRVAEVASPTPWQQGERRPHHGTNRRRRSKLQQLQDAVEEESLGWGANQAVIGDWSTVEKHPARLMFQK